MNIINRQPDFPKTFRRDSPPGANAAAGIAAGIAAGRISPADEITKNIFYLAARKFPKKKAPQKSAAKKTRRRPFPSHDHLFREIFLNERFAADVLFLALSRERFKFLDMKTLKLRNPVLFTKEGRERRADLIFSVSTKSFPRSEKPPREWPEGSPLRLSRGPGSRERAGAGAKAGAKAGAGAGAGLRRAHESPGKSAQTDRAEMLIIFEHKSRGRPEHLQQLLDYLSAARLTWSKKGLMLPVLVCAGRKRERPLDDFQGSLRDVFQKQLELFGEADVNFRPVILNLRDVDLKKKARGLKALPIWFILQNVHDIGRRDVAEFFRLCGDLSERDRQFLGPRGLAYLMRYNPRWTAEDLAEIERKTIKKKGGIMTVSYYQEDLNKARQEGMQKGRQEGMQKGRKEGRQERDRELVSSMLQEDLDASLIAKVTGLSAKKIRRLKNGAAE